MDYRLGFAEVSFVLFWWFILMCDLLLPITLLIAGKMMWKHCPKQINGVLGYRTARSMKNMDTWRFAHEYWIIHDRTFRTDTYPILSRR